MEEIKVNIEFTDGSRQPTKLTFRNSVFVPTFGEEIRFADSKEFYLVKRVIRHFLDDETDFTIELEPC